LQKTGSRIAGKARRGGMVIEIYLGVENGMILENDLDSGKKPRKGSMTIET